MVRKTAVSTVHWIFQTNNTVSEARTLVSNLARNKNLKTSILAICLVHSALVEQTWGQSTCRDTVSFPGLSDWGIDSLYQRDRGIRGAASCATSSCHGGPRVGVSSADAPRGSEYPLWLESDPHARSWKTFSSDASVRILTKLSILRDGKIVNIAAYQNCLACHNTDRKIGIDQLSPRIAEGVGCESCHGPSESWYDRHFQGLESAKNAIANLGLTDSGSLVQRARICSMCHVGSKDRDMNHDIIAAGHPALYFDMAVYHEAYPKHWRDKDQNEKIFRSQLWLAGKIAMVDAELEMLESRACKLLSVSTWPELSIYQCNSCHVTLGSVPKPLRTMDRDMVVMGRAPVRNWNLEGIAVLSQNPVQSESESELLASLNALRALLQSPNPDSKLVAAKSRRLRIQFHDALIQDGKLTLPNWTRQNQTELSIYLLEKTTRSNSWETAAGAYTAAWATQPKITQGNLDVAMKTMRNGLLFPKDLMTPNFPRLPNGATPPTWDEWNVSLQQAISGLKNEDRK